MKTKDNHKPEKKHEYNKKDNGKNDTGRPVKYESKYCNDILEYFEKCQAEILIDIKFFQGNKNNPVSTIINPLIIDKEVEKSLQTLSASSVKSIEQKLVMNRFPTFIRYARKIGVDEDTLLNREKDNEDFLSARRQCKKIQEAILLENGLQGTYNSQFAMFLLKNNHGYKDKQEIQNTNVDLPLTPEQQKALIDRFELDK